MQRIFFFFLPLLALASVIIKIHTLDELRGKSTKMKKVTKKKEKQTHEHTRSTANEMLARESKEKRNQKKKKKTRGKNVKKSFKCEK